MLANIVEKWCLRGWYKNQKIPDLCGGAEQLRQEKTRLKRSGHSSPGFPLNTMSYCSGSSIAMISFAYTIGVLRLIRVEIQTGELDNLTPTQRLLLIVLASFANSEGECWPSQKKLGKLVGVSRPRVSGCLKILEQEKLIESAFRQSDNGTQTKIYRMLFEPFVFKRIREENFNCFGQRVDDPRMTDTSWAE
ncbi:helix-turn-helix domain-containing protein [Endozoicomonas sp. SCSIO W0465]|uniref:helix-turn-helix domain-containing protein n=1 Tax=Endozoicomonas sp. SCSIO W0465 TaxID=2918516 RepID=UPI002075ED10|nr:helix-turn-helix domain-containing protein [Endozoicomonas sp. SCSIO W0465]USE36354.1 helix-turn-helix domain-containing protein [Endozoicomonas sp. SCSIO W0465]